MVFLKCLSLTLSIQMLEIYEVLEHHFFVSKNWWLLLLTISSHLLLDSLQPIWRCRSFLSVNKTSFVLKAQLVRQVRRKTVFIFNTRSDEILIRRKNVINPTFKMRQKWWLFAFYHIHFVQSILLCQSFQNLKRSCFALNRKMSDFRNNCRKSR